jgi:polycomb protein EED
MIKTKSKPNATNKQSPAATQHSSAPSLQVNWTHFRPCSRIQQSQRQPLYCVCWSNDIHVEEQGYENATKFRYLATCGSNCVTIYEAAIDGGNSKGEFTAKQSYKDDDNDEQFHACVYGGRSPRMSTRDCTQESVDEVRAGQKRPRSDEESELDTSILLSSSDPQIIESTLNDGPQFLIVAGARGVVKVINTVSKSLQTQLYGHSSDIYDLKVSPTDEWLLLSASVDESIRLWNLKSFACVAIFAGRHGHREAVLSLSWHGNGDQFASSGVDQSIRLWRVQEGRTEEALQASQKVANKEERKSFQPLCVQFPYFATEKVHLNFVDCVQFVGDMILSKSTYNIIVLWIPDIPTLTDCSLNSAAFAPPSDVITLRTFELVHCDLWFVRFGVDGKAQRLAVGNIKGEIDVWDIDSSKKGPIQTLKPMIHSTVRMVSFSPDGKTLVACHDSGTICKWDS